MPREEEYVFKGPDDPDVKEMMDRIGGSIRCRCGLEKRSWSELCGYCFNSLPDEIIESIKRGDENSVGRAVRYLDNPYLKNETSRQKFSRLSGMYKRGERLGDDDYKWWNRLRYGKFAMRKLRDWDVTNILLNSADVYVSNSVRGT